MKTLKRNSEIIRVGENKVDYYLNLGYSYTSKSDWKKNVRDVEKQSKTESKKEKKEKK